MRIYYFTNEEFGLENLEYQRLKVARINNLNDPFEHLSIDLSDANDRIVFKHTKNTINENSGILCFSQNWQNPLLWGHYADKYKGICIGFDIPDESDNYKAITYIKEREKIEGLKTNDPESPYTKEIVEKILFTKYSDWSYEQEIRLFFDITKMTKDPEKQIYFQEFNEELTLAVIYIGIRSTLTKDRITEIVKHYAPEIEIFNTGISYNKYEIVKLGEEGLG